MVIKGKRPYHLLRFRRGSAEALDLGVAPVELAAGSRELFPQCRAIGQSGRLGVCALASVTQSLIALRS
jgi:hypothetical protein